jgi:23S rRNA pseudouridine1911/1915/1917 synthase
MAEVGHRLLEPGLLQRLDNGTSGLLVAARTKEAFEQATGALKHTLWRKSYLALIDGAKLPERGLIRGELEPWPSHPERVRVKTEHTLLQLSAHDAFPAPSGSMETLVATRGSLQQVRVFVGPAFRHQIRAHFATIGAALVNDEVYGAPRETRLAKGRHALHAANVAWDGAPPLEGFDVTEPLERDLADLFDNEGT